MYTTKSIIGQNSASARRFWESRVKEEVITIENGSPVWSDINCTIKDRRYCRSPASSRSASRSVTPTSVTSDRTTPSPSALRRTTSRTMLEDLLPSSPRHPEMMSGPTRSKSEDLLLSRRTSVTAQRFQTTCFLQPMPVPTRMVAQRFSEGMSTTRSELGKVYSSNLTIPCEPPIFISLESQQINGLDKITNGGNMILTKEEFL